jgi:hypothetical protein
MECKDPKLDCKLSKLGCKDAKLSRLVMVEIEAVSVEVLDGELP